MSTIPPVSRRDRLPVSFTQEERLSAGRHVQLVHNKIAIGLRFDGPLDVAVLERCVAALVTRHESLRLVFPEHAPARPRLAVRPDDGCELTVLSATDVDHALRLLAEDACAPFVLATGPLFRATLAVVDADTHVLCLTMDHIVIDAWSVRVLLTELLALYAAYAVGAEPDLPALPVQFPDFAAWERGHLTGANLHRMMGYWRGKLDGIDPIPSSGLVDPAVRPDGPVRLVKATRLLDPELTDRLTELARAERTSLIAVVSAAVKAAMWKRRRETMPDELAGDVATFGSLANRTRPELEHMVGYVATPATFRTQFDGGTAFRELLTREARTLWGAMRHQGLPHSLIMKELGHPQYGVRFSEPALLPAYFNFDFDLVEDETETLPQPPGLRVAPVGVPTPEVPRGGLRLIAYRRTAGLLLELRYRDDRYGAPWVGEFLADTHAVLGQAVIDPAIAVHKALGVTR
ncbi:condensation domain-containing protein [Longispora sp. K20-0274]|uniref:condensation domain-containing protein n=1 Tax=Longispora sp. K20-0274 TaxID=3088255 RepID=UPI00399A3263